MFRAYCNNAGCSTEIKNVEPWLLEVIPDKWQCRPCFYNEKEPVGQSVSAEFEDTSIGDIEAITEVMD